MSSPIRILLCSGSDAGISTQLALHAAKKSGWVPIDWANPSAENEESPFYLALLNALGVSDAAVAVAEAWSSTSIVRSVIHALATWNSLDAESRFVIDCGEISKFLAELNDVRALREIALHAMRPELLMDDAGRHLHAQLSGSIQALEALFESLTTQAVVRVAVRPGSFAVGEISRIALDCAVLGLVLDCVVVAPAGKKIGTSEVLRFKGDLSEARPDIPVVRAEEMRAGPKGHLVHERCTDALAVGSVREHPGPDSGTYVGEVLASGLDSAELRVGVLHEHLVLATPRVRRVLPLPSTLVRCTPRDAGVDEAGAHINFSVEPSLWPEAFAAEAGLSVGEQDD